MVETSLWSHQRILTKLPKDFPLVLTKGKYIDRAGDQWFKCALDGLFMYDRMI